MHTKFIKSLYFNFVAFILYIISNMIFCISIWLSVKFITIKYWLIINIKYSLVIYFFKYITTNNVLVARTVAEVYKREWYIYHTSLSHTQLHYIRRKILPVRCVYSHFCRRMPLHGKQRSTTTSVRKFAGAAILALAYKCRRMRASRRGLYSLVAELLQKVNKALSQT